MHRRLLLFLFLCLSIMVRGQAVYEYRYWYDGDESTMHTGTSENGAWQMNLDIGTLDYSFHSVCIQVKDTAGVWSAAKTRYFVKLPGSQAYNIEYWIDGDWQKKAAIANGGIADLDVSGLEEGLHTISIIAANPESPSSPRTAVFWKQAVPSKTKYRLWFDNDTEQSVSGQYTGKPVEIDVSKLDDGFHIVHTQVENTSPSQPQTSMFIKVPQTQGIDYMACICMVDGKEYRQERVPTSGGIINWTLDAADMKPGIHKMQAYIVTPSGVASGLKEAFFYRAMTTGERGNIKCLYAIDGSDHYVQAGNVSGNLFHFDIDASLLADGFHSLSYMLVTEDGTSSKVMSSYFVKTPLGGNGVTQYDYWLNDNEANRKMVKIAERANPLQLMTLLPVEPHPIRSSSFKFEVGKDGKPMMYAKNDLHMRFYDVAGRILEASRQFVDYNVKKEISGITLLEDSEGRQNIIKPEGDEVLWYAVNMNIGDSIAVRSSKASSIQIFSPKGDELYNVSGSESVTFDGLHAYEKGKYHIALHDVMSTDNAPVDFDYQHIDKNAVLDYSPKMFGTPSHVNLNIVGNGFTDSTKVVISRDKERYVAKSVSAASISNIVAEFEFPDTIAGVYSLNVIFSANDSIVKDKAITIAKADSVPTIKVSLEGNPYFLAGSSAKYYVNITNNSNIPVYCLPYSITIDCVDGDETTISSIKVDDAIGGECKADLYNWLLAYTNKEKALEVVNSIFANDNVFFYTFKDSVTGKTYIKGDFTLPYINANSTVRIPVTIEKVTHNFKLYASVKKHWNFANYINNAGGSGSSGGSGSGGDGGSGSGSGGNGGSGSGSGSGGSGSGSGSGSSGSGSGSGSSGSGSGSGSSGSGSGSGSSGSGSGSECCVRTAAHCIVTLVSSCVDLAPVISEYADVCVYNHLEDGMTSIFSDIFCAGNSPDLSKLPKAPAPVIMDVTSSMIKCAIENGFSIGGQAAVNYILDWATRNSWGKFKKVYDISKNCLYEPAKVWVRGCGDDDDDNDDAEPINSYDSNDIYGYKAESGSRYVKKDLDMMSYTIEFENSPDFATASAHEVIIRDTLDYDRFDLASFQPKSIQIGDRLVYLEDDATLTTIDMRPEINAVAQVEIDYDNKKGIAQWRFASLDPMTMEKTNNPMSGFLPVNSGGNGIGEVTFDIALKQNYNDGIEINNRAAITFDNNDVILTPVWTNVTDTIAPTSQITFAAAQDSIVTLRFESDDNRSGVWKYNLYVQDTEGGRWTKVEDEITSAEYKFHGNNGFNYGFCVMAVDSAGNVEQKELAREISQATFKYGDANGDGKVNSEDISLAVEYYINGKAALNFAATDISQDGKINSEDISLIVEQYTSSSVNGKKRLPRKRRTINNKIVTR